MPYKEWIAKVNKILMYELYLPGLRDLPDYICWKDLYESGLTPREALRGNIGELTDGFFSPADVK